MILCLIFVFVVLPGCSKNLRGTVSLIPAEKSKISPEDHSIAGWLAGVVSVTRHTGREKYGRFF
jgi:hypothetical protein